jgi:maltooligosyltrehalose trehalohydrolase
MSREFKRWPVGAEVTGDGVHFRLWAPAARQVELVTNGSAVRLRDEGNGYFSTAMLGVGAGLRYQFRLAGNDRLYPDPASRFQPDGPHGASQVVDPRAYAWRHPRRGARREGHVIYEMHIGTLTQEGTFRSAIGELPRLAELGITLIELMPVNEFAGRFNWGYDGVGLYAPSHVYGSPDDLRAFVDEAHGLGMGVILDVVYNHLGPEGNYLKVFSPHYFSSRYATDWGEAINFDGEQCGPVREFFASNAAYWISDFRMDGLRIDATQCLYDASPRHIIADLVQAARDAADGPVCMVAENEPQDVLFLSAAEAGGHGGDAMWNDDFHHTARVALTGRREGYLRDYGGSAQEFVSAARRGFLYQGQYYAWQKKNRGTPTAGHPAAAFINYIENHDQVANHGLGKRLITVASPGELRAMTALLLLAPGTPMLFQGQEFGSTADFTFFADHEPEVARLTHEGRRKFLAQFPSLATAEVQRRVPDPSSPETFHACKLLARERDANSGLLRLHKDLIRLRRTDPAFAAQDGDSLDGAILGPRAFILRFCPPRAQERALLVNLGGDLELKPCPEPLVAPPRGSRWRQLWSSEEVHYGGGGAPPVILEGSLRLSGRSACVLGPVPV